MELKKLQVPVELKQSRPRLRMEKKDLSLLWQQPTADTTVIDRLSMRGSSDYGSRRSLARLSPSQRSIFLVEINADHRVSLSGSFMILNRPRELHRT